MKSILKLDTSNKASSLASFIKVLIEFPAPPVVQFFTAYDATAFHTKSDKGLPVWKGPVMIQYHLWWSKKNVDSLGCAQSNKFNVFKWIFDYPSETSILSKPFKTCFSDSDSAKSP